MFIKEVLMNGEKQKSMSGNVIASETAAGTGSEGDERANRQALGGGSG
jgi:hypothetical protein